MDVISTFSVSDLPAVHTLDHDDLLMVSDYDGKDRKCFTRKLMMSTLYDSISEDSIISSSILGSSKAIGKAVDLKISALVYDIIEAEVKKHIKANLSDIVLATIAENYNTVNDMLDGTIDSLLVIRSDFDLNGDQPNA